MIDEGFILSAGYGKRMRPLTDKLPKPLVPLAGVPLLAHSLTKIKNHGVKRLVINSHYKADKIREFVRNIQDPEIQISHEETLLDTGGGVRNALAHIKSSAFFVVAGDAYWEDACKEPALQMLEKAWDPEEMDILVLLQSVADMNLTAGTGDYDFIDKPQDDFPAPILRSRDKGGRYMFTNLRINSRRIFEACENKAFSFLELMDAAEKAGRLYGLTYPGRWHHISTPEDLTAVETYLRGRNS